MVDLAGRPPLGQKVTKPERSDVHLNRVRALPCVICNASPPSHAHHCISERYGQHRTSDYMAIPLCFEHHQGMTGIHANKATWESAHGPDWGFVTAKIP